MAFLDAKYLVSAAGREQWPPSNKPEVLLVGKSNAGKSSLLNTLFDNQNLAKVGKTPGKTRLLNFFDSKNLVFVDAPGYGYAARSREELADYAQMMEDYLNYRENLKLIIWILDIRRTPNDDDLLMLRWLRHSEKNFFLIINKADKLSYSQQLKQRGLIIRTLSLREDQVLVFSAKTKLGRTRLIDTCSALIND